MRALPVLCLLTVGCDGHMRFDLFQELEALGAGTWGEPLPDSTPELRVQAVERAAAFRVLGPELDGVDPGATVPCPDDRIIAARRSSPSVPMALWTVDHAHLPSRAGDHGWAMFDSYFAEDLQALAADPDGDHYDFVYRFVGAPHRRFLGVVMHDGGGAHPELIPGERAFISGQFEGALVVVDLDELEPLCQVPLAFESSSTVRDDQPFNEVLDDLYVGADFAKRKKKAMRAALSRISDQLTVQ